jgi:arabinofuranosyltransferase
VLLVPARRVTVAAVVLVGVWAALCVGPWNPGAYHRSDTATAIRVRNTDIAITGTANPDTAAAWAHAFPGLRAAVALGRGQERPVLVRMGPAGEPDALLPLNPVYRDTHVSVPGGYLGATGQVVPLDERIVEVWGLANTIGAHLEYPSDWRTKWPGHRKLVDGAWLLALDLDPAVTVVPPGSIDVTAASLAAARHALTCGALAELLASTREPLTPARFVANLTGAAARTTLRIPRDPFAAEARFCAAPH